MKLSSKVHNKLLHTKKYSLHSHLLGVQGVMLKMITEKEINMAEADNNESHSDTVRRYCVTNYLQPARARGDYTFSINSGDVHQALKFANKYPLVCSAIGAERFESEYNVSRLAITGPLNSSRTIFTFLIKG